MHAKGQKKLRFRPGVPFHTRNGTDGTAGTRNNIKNYIISSQRAEQ